MIIESAGRDEEHLSFGAELAAHRHQLRDHLQLRAKTALRISRCRKGGACRRRLAKRLRHLIVENQRARSSQTEQILELVRAAAPDQRLKQCARGRRALQAVPRTECDWPARRYGILKRRTPGQENGIAARIDAGQARRAIARLEQIADPPPQPDAEPSGDEACQKLC